MTSAGLNVSSKSDQTRNFDPRPADTTREKNPALPVTEIRPIGTQRPRHRRWSR
jgi:hypothetical protein